MSAPEPDAEARHRIKFSDLNVLLRGAGARHTAECLANLLGIIGLRVLALEAQRP